MEGRIEADHVQVGSRVTLGPGSSIRAQHVVLGDDVVIGDDVEIVCDRLELASGCRVPATDRATTAGHLPKTDEKSLKKAQKRPKSAKKHQKMP